MTGQIIINGVDIKNAFGIVLLEGSAESLVQFPASRPPAYNDWQEEDGIEVDLSTPTFEPRQVNLRFATCRTTANVPAFINALTTQSQLTTSIPEVGVTRTLRFVECTSLTGVPGKLRRLEILFIEDKPLLNYEYITPSTSLNRIEKYFLSTGAFNNKPLKNYNIIVLEGTDEQLEKTSGVKAALSTSSRKLNGQQYDYAAPVKFKEKTASIKLLMITGTTQEFSQKIDAFFFDLMRPGIKTLLRESTGVQYKFFYAGCRVRKVSTYNMTQQNTGVWCEMDVDIIITNKAG
jgi:hypothetical protein